MSPPPGLSAREEAIFVKLRDEQAHGVIPTPADGLLVAQWAKAQVRLEDTEALLGNSAYLDQV